MAYTRARQRSRWYRNLLIVLQADDRYDVFQTWEDERDKRPIAENFPEISSAMEWIDADYCKP